MSLAAASSRRSRDGPGHRFGSGFRLASVPHERSPSTPCGGSCAPHAWIQGQPFRPLGAGWSLYSPIPNEADVTRAKRRLRDAGPTLPGIDVDPGRLLEEFRARAVLVHDWNPSPRDRYHPENDAFGIGDASMLRASVLLLQPSRVIEVGSGWSSACLLDAIDDGSLSTHVTFIEPHPKVLFDRLRPTDLQRVEIIQLGLQDIPTDRFRELVAGDVLFIDSSHVLKPGSDVDDSFARVLPALAAGVVVHIHDIHWPFEVSPEWLDEGRAWNESHALRNFLYGNTHWEIVLFNNYLARFHRDVIEMQLPRVLVNSGGSIWLRRRDS